MASVRKRTMASGETRWDVRYRDPNRVQRTRSFSRKFEADRFASAIETDIDRGDRVNPELARETFSYWAEQWLATTYHLKPKTQEGYELKVCVPVSHEPSTFLKDSAIPRLASQAGICVVGGD